MMTINLMRTGVCAAANDEHEHYPRHKCVARAGFPYQVDACLVAWETLLVTSDGDAAGAKT